MPAPASGCSPSLTSPSTAAPPRWPGAQAGGLTRGWSGCTPITRAAPTRSRSAAPAAAVPFLPTARSRARRGGLRRPAHGRDATARRGRPRAALDVAPPGRLGPRAVRVGVLPRDDPRGSAPPQAVLEEGQEAAGPGRPGAATGVPRAAPRCSGRRSTLASSGCTFQRQAERMMFGAGWELRHMSISELMHRPERARRIEVFTGAGRRRTWPTDEKAAIVAESYAPGRTVWGLAPRHGPPPPNLYTCPRPPLRARLPVQEPPVRFVPV